MNSKVRNLYTTWNKEETVLSATVKMDKPWKPMGEWQWYFCWSDWLQDWVYQGCFMVWNYMQPQNHRIIQAGRDLQDYLVQSPWHGQEYKESCNLSLNTSRDGASTASLSNLFQYLTRLKVNIFFPIIYLNLPFFSLKPFHIVLSLHTLLKRACPFHFSHRPMKSSTYV